MASEKSAASAQPSGYRVGYRVRVRAAAATFVVVTVRLCCGASGKRIKKMKGSHFGLFPPSPHQTRAPLRAETPKETHFGLRRDLSMPGNRAANLNNQA